MSVNMISQFWSLCRACPALDVDKLHSEYRSTYRWHEFTPKQQDVIKKPPPTLKDDITFPRKKKHPDVAYRSHDFFESDLRPTTLVPISTNSSGGDETDSGRKTRPQRRSNKMFANGETHYSRRARSEGPVHRVPRLSAVPSKPKHTAAAQPSKNDERKDNSHPPQAPSSKWNSNESRHKAMKESMSMGQILSTGNAATQHSSTNSKGGDDKVKINGDIKEKPSSDIVPRRRSEYRQCFRPFSQYEYLDGRFIPSPGTSSPPSDSEPERQINRKQSKQASLHGEPWYREVVELRKQAMDYKCRGWGTEPNKKRAELYEQTCKRKSLSALSLAITTPRASEPSKKESSRQHSASSTSPTKRGRLSRPRTAPSTRGSAKSSRSESAHPASDASALPSSSLKSTGDAGDTPRTGIKSSSSPLSNRSKSVGPSRPKVGLHRPPSGPPQLPSSTLSSSESGARVHNDLPRRQRPTTLKTNSCNEKPPLPPSSLDPSHPPSKKDHIHPQPHKHPPQPTTAATSSLKEKKPPMRGAIFKQDKEASSSSLLETLDPSSAGATTSKSGCGSTSSSGNRPGEEVVTFRAISDSGRRPMSRSSSKTSSRPPSAIENNLDYFREPVVKSPPEPTRVKSPEQMVRSPDPINWTVPLDTAKTFSVTQSVREGESARQSPMSDYSSHFDSVSGTAINLGMMSRNERGAAPVHPPKISSLAKEAREPTPGFTKDSTMTRPSGGSGVPARPIREPTPSNTNGTSDAKKSEDVLEKPVDSSLNNGNNGSSEEDKKASDNKKKNGDDPKVEPSSIPTANPTGLKCLDDPSFSFEGKAPPKKPAYTVLEDPFESPASGDGKPGGSTPAPTASPYKVLEDPSMSSLDSLGFDPSATSAAKRPIVPAAEVLEGARERFDKFWAKPGDK